MAGDVDGAAQVRLGHSELWVRPIGLGCMGMSQFYGSADDRESVQTIRRSPGCWLSHSTWSPFPGPNASNT
jgi:hypothetical protein